MENEDNITLEEYLKKPRNAQDPEKVKRVEAMKFDVTLDGFELAVTAAAIATQLNAGKTVGEAIMETPEFKKLEGVLARLMLLMETQKGKA